MHLCYLLFSSIYIGKNNVCVVELEKNHFKMETESNAKTSRPLHKCSIIFVPHSKTRYQTTNQCLIHSYDVFYATIHYRDEIYGCK